MPPSRYQVILSQTFDSVRELGVVKGSEYSGDEDRLANFRRAGSELNVTPELVWRVYAGKHWDAITTYVRDVEAGHERERSEPITGRIDDLIVYLLLFKAMYEARHG